MAGSSSFLEAPVLGCDDNSLFGPELLIRIPAFLVQYNVRRPWKGEAVRKRN